MSNWRKSLGALAFLLLIIVPPSPAGPMPGDANSDNIVNIDDLGILASNYDTTGRNWSQGDFTGDGAVNVDDLGVLASNYDKYRIVANKDVWLSAVGSEQNYNMGAATSIKLKVLQEFGLVNFNITPLIGKNISSAKLFVKPAGGGTLNLNDGITDLRWLTVSTVGHDWVEGLSSGYGTDPTGHGATFNESSYQLADWAFAGAKCWDVSLGNGNTIRTDCWMQASPGRAGWQEMDLDVRLVQAMIARAAYGFCLMDGSTYYGVNNKISARESGNGAYIEVVTTDADTTPPAAPTELAAQPAPNRATPSLGAIDVSLRVPADAFCFNVKVNGVAVERWQIPFAAAAGTVQTFGIRDLTPGAAVTVAVTAVDAAGNESPTATAPTTVSPKLTVPALPASPFTPAAGAPRTLGAASVWAFPEVTKVDPVTKAVLHEQGATNFRTVNPVWDGATGTIRLAAAKGEIVSFQLAIEGAATGLSVQVSNLTGPGAIPNTGAKLWRNWYVQMQSEYALPLTLGANYNLPFTDNVISGRTLQALTLDLFIPKTTPAGNYTGTATLTAGANQLALPFNVKVYNVTIPDETHFVPELNCYGGPGTAGGSQFQNSFRLAHYHRNTINRVPYGQTGNVSADWSPIVGADGHVTSWAGFDANLGGLLDGTWFATNPRASVPVPRLYLPLFEGWPLNFLNYYNPGAGVPTSPSNDNTVKLRHDTLALPIDQAMAETYKTAFKNCTADFVSHFNTKGWNKTLMEFYLNNKPSYNYTLWTLDEPDEYLDWAALNFFGRLYKEAVNDPEAYTYAFHKQLYEQGLVSMNRGRSTFLYRGDISRPMWQGGVSDGIINIMYVGGEFPNVARILADQKERMPVTLNWYGSCNAVDTSDWISAQWCLKSFTLNGDGVLPWQSLAGSAAMTAYDVNGLIIDGGAYGSALASFRVHAMRRGAQECELLRLLQLKNGWSRGHCGVLAAQKVPLTSQFPQNFTDPNDQIKYGTLTSIGMVELKEGVLQLLELP